jgi:hypothetical protein
MEEKQIRNTQQHAVPIPLWLQKRMVRNLEQAARNKVSPSRAKGAMAVLQTLAEENKLAHTNTPLVTKPTVAGAGKCEPTAAERATSRIKKVLKATVTRYTDRLRRFRSNLNHRSRSKAAAVSSQNALGRR